MKFPNRKFAGERLGERLVQYLEQHDLKNSNDLVVVGLPRGGVPVAYEVAKRLQCPLEILASKKLPFPGQPEFAIGAVSSDGIVVLNPDIPVGEDWRHYVEQQRRGLLQKTAEIENQYYKRAGRPHRTDFKDKIVILIDDGVATGMTAIAALETFKERGAKMTIVAAPVMGKESYATLAEHASEVIALFLPDDFQAVGAHYQDFSQTTDEEVVQALRDSEVNNLPLKHKTNSVGN